VLGITHRPAEAALFSRVVAMDHGRVVNEGDGVGEAIRQEEAQATGGNG
jgi:hypothetical protein